MKIQCPQCGVAGSVDEAHRGKKVKCPKCNMIFVVAKASEEEFSPPSVAAASSPASLVDEPAARETIQCPQCGVAGSVDESHRGKKVKCPKCNMKFVVAVTSEEEFSAPLVAVVPSPASLADEPAAIETVPAVSAHIETVESSDILLPVDKGASPQDPPPVGGTPATLFEGERGEPLPEPEERLEWADTVSDMDKGEVDKGKRGREKDVAPASFEEPLATILETGDGGVSGTETVGAGVAGPSPPSGLGMELPLAAAVAATDLASDDKQDKPEAKIVLDGVEQSPYGVEKEQCWQCGKKDSVGVPFIAKDGRLYCADCLPGKTTEPPPAGNMSDVHAASQPHYDVGIGGLLRKAWAKIYRTLFGAEKKAD
jgi:ssDNA-binding Zn-finger/Zn-ribbon topoisomerase 1